METDVNAGCERLRRFASRRGDTHAPDLPLRHELRRRGASSQSWRLDLIRHDITDCIDMDRLMTETGQYPLEALTPAEQRILRLLGNGYTNREIAQLAFVSQNTVKYHLKNIYGKWRISSRTQVVLRARGLAVQTLSQRRAIIPFDL